MKQQHSKKIFFTKETIAILNKNSLTQIMGGSVRSELDPTGSSFHSDGPPHTSIEGSDQQTATSSQC